MAELAIPLRIDITADGTAAVTEIQNVGNAAQTAGKQAGNLASNSQSAASGIQSMGTSAQSATNQLKSVSDQLTKIGSSMTKLVTTPIVAAYTASVKGAADLTETVSKTETVFGNFYSNVERWSETSIETMGIAQSTALEMASLYGDMATGMGFSQSAASEMSMSLTSLAADLASFKNISIDTAETALKSVFTGETESLKNLGVVMTEANLKAYALAQGIETEYSAMSQAEKVTLRYQYVMAQTSTAQGDFTRTGDSLSNKLRKLGQTIKQVGEQIGQLIVPYVTTIVDKIQAAVTWISSLDDGVKNMILTIGAVAAAIGPLILVGTKLLKLVTAIKTALSLSTLLPVIAAITAAVAGATLLVGAFKNTRQEVDKTTQSYQTAKETIEQGISTSVTVDTTEIDELEGKTVSGSIVIGASNETRALIKNVQNIASDLQNSATKMSGTITLNGSTTEAQEALQAVQDEVSALLTSSEDGGTTSIADLQAAIDKCKALEIDPSLDTEQAAAIQEQIDSMVAGVEKLKNVTVTFAEDESTQDTVNELTSVLDQLQGDEDITKNIYLNGSNASALEALNGLETAVDNLISGDGTIAELQAAIDACQDLEIDPTVDASLYRLASGKLNYLKGLCDDIQEVDVVLTCTETEESNRRAIDSFITKVNDMGWTSKSFDVTGTFTVPARTMDTMNEYAEALTAAATATGDYEEAVESLNSILDEELNQQIQEVNAQATEDIKNLAIQYNSGLIDKEEYEAGVETIVTGAKQTTEELKAETEAAKELNDIFANGTAEDDATGVADQAAALYEGQTFTTEDYQGAYAQLAAASAAGEDMTNYVNTAKVALAGLGADSETIFNSMTEATDKYNTSLQEAAASEEKAAEANAGAEYTEELMRRTVDFNTWITTEQDGYQSVVNGTAIEDFVAKLGLADEEAAKLQESMTKLFADENGELPDNVTEYSEKTMEQMDNLQSMGEEYRTTAEEYTSKAETIRTQAVADYDSAMQQIADTAALTTQDVQGALALINEAGVEVPEATLEQLGSVWGLLESVNDSLNGSDQAAADAVARTLDTVASDTESAKASGEPVGEALLDGITVGVQNGTGALGNAMDKAIREGIDAAKKAAGIQSPSKVMREQVGKMLMQGVSVGMDDETPTVLERIKSGMNKIISGAQSIVTGSSLSFPTTLALSNGMNIDYNRMGEALSNAVQDSPVSLVIKDKTIAETTSDATWRAQAIKAQRINRGKGRW